MVKYKGFYQNIDFAQYVGVTQLRPLTKSILSGSTCSIELKYATRKLATGELAVLFSLTLQVLSCVILN